MCDEIERFLIPDVLHLIGQSSNQSQPIGTNMTTQTYLSDAQIAARYGNHRTWTWRRLKADPKFPKPVKLSSGTTRWKLTDIEAWEASKLAEK